MKSLKPFTSVLTFAMVTFVTGCLALTSHDDPWNCALDSDCDDGQRCKDTNDGLRCVAADYCVSYGYQDGFYCDAGTVCVDSHCVPGNCLSSENCSEYVCDAATHLCKTSCAADEDCQHTYATCQDGTCVDPECYDYTQCKGYACVVGTCAKSCKKTTDCATGYTCTATKCIKQ